MMLSNRTPDIVSSSQRYACVMSITIHRAFSKMKEYQVSSLIALKGEINRKLEKEEENISFLKQTLTKSNNLTHGMTAILTSFEERLAKLEKTVLPVYHETANLQRRQENIERTLGALDNVIGYYNVSTEVEEIIKNGPLGNLEKYLESMTRIQNAIKYFEKNGPHSPELISLVALLESGGDNLERDFRTLLNRHYKPTQPIAILNMINLDEDLAMANFPTDHLPEQSSQELMQIANWLVKNKREDFISVYASIRSSILLRSLQGLKDYQKSASGSSNLNLNPYNSPMLSRSRAKETPTRKTARKIQQALAKRSTLSSVKHVPGNELTPGSGHRRQGSFLEPRDDAMDLEVENYLTCVTALCKLMELEVKSMKGIIPRKHEKTIFDRIIQQALDSIVEDGENIATTAKRCTGKHEYSTALIVFPIVKHLIMQKQEFDQLVEGCQPATKAKWHSLISLLHSAGAKMLDDFIDCIKNDPDRQMPKDGTVHELTSNAMMFLEQLLDYVENIGAVLCQDPTYHNALAKVEESNRNKASVAVYIIRVLSSLGLALNNKSEMYNDLYLKAIFRLNNMHYIQKSLQRSGLMDIVKIYSPELEDHYDNQVLEQKRLYSQSWSRTLHYVMEVDRPVATNLNLKSKLKDKDRQNIKDKFTGFNKEMEDIYRVQKGYAIPDVELRESLKRDNKEFILPKYQAFYDKYCQVPFTKNAEKYIKYSPVMVSHQIDKFFDVTA